MSLKIYEFYTHHSSQVYIGENTLFWREKWLGDTPLIEECLQPLDPATSFKLVKDYWEIGRGWKWKDLEGLISSSSLSLISNKILRTAMVVATGSVGVLLLMGLSG